MGDGVSVQVSVMALLLALVAVAILVLPEAQRGWTLAGIALLSAMLFVRPPPRRRRSDRSLIE